MKPQRLTKARLDSIFEEAKDQETALIAIYRCAFPDWDQVEKVSGWPSVNKTTWKRICGRFMELDGKYHPDVMAGGCWMNTGFSSVPDEELKDGMISLEGVDAVYAS
jgi:hypothetical protein